MKLDFADGQSKQGTGIIILPEYFDRAMIEMFNVNPKALIHGPGRRVRPVRRAQFAGCVALSIAGWPQTQIHRHLGVKPETIRRVIRDPEHRANGEILAALAHAMWQARVHEILQAAEERAS